MTHVLITGIAGFVGSHIVEHIQATRPTWQISGLASLRHRGDALRCESFGPDVSIYRAELTGPVSPRLADRLGAVDIIINAAAESHVDRSIEDPRPFIENNVSVAVTMLEYAREVRPSHFFQISTDEVYGPYEPGFAASEWDPILPSNPYSASKAAQEAIAISYWRTYDIPVILTNTMNMFGERQDSEKFIPLVMKKLMAGERIGLHGTPDNIGSRSYLHARNHADALLHLSEMSPSRFAEGASVPDRWNIAGDREVDNLEMADMISEIMGLPLRYEWVGDNTARPGHDLRYALNDTKLKGTGWTPPLPLEASLDRTITWTMMHPEWLR